MPAIPHHRGRYRAWRRAGRCRLAEVDAVQPGEQIDHLAPDGPGLDADPRVVAVDRRGRARCLVASRTMRNAPPGEGLAEHHGGRPSFEHRVQGGEHFVGGAADVGGEEQPQAAPLVARLLDGGNSPAGALGHRRVVQVRV